MTVGFNVDKSYVNADLMLTESYVTCMTRRLNGQQVVHSGSSIAMSGGFTSGSYISGFNLTAGITPDPLVQGNNYILMTNNGAGTITSTNAGNSAWIMSLIIMNNATAGTVTLSGYNAITGDLFDTTNGSIFWVTLRKHGSITTANVEKIA